MTRYKTKLLSLDKLPISHKGVAEPLCDRCANQDCSNPIFPRKLSVFGVSKTYKCYVSHMSPQFVIQCEGFVQQGQVSTIDEDAPIPDDEE